MFMESSMAARRVIAPPTADALAETFKVLGDATRVRILDAISQSELCVCDIAALVGHSESAVSHQLRLLRGMRLVRPRRQGRQVFYALDDHHIVDLFEQGLEHVQERVESRFSRMGPIGSAHVGSGSSRISSTRSGHAESRASRTRTGRTAKRATVRGRRS
jgi:ArsR family transcriptional regulator, lead/cadmium/zinc/bismuth-responsive transcriptional repressor